MIPEGPSCHRCAAAASPCSSGGAEFTKRPSIAGCGACRNFDAVTAPELHTQIAEFVHNRLNEGEYRARMRGLAEDSSETGPAYTRDLAARLSLTRNDAPTDNSEPAASLPQGDGSSNDRPAARAQHEAPPPPETAIDRFALRTVSGGLIVAALVIAVIGIVLVTRNTEAQEGLNIAEADSAAPVQVEVTQPRNLFNEATSNFELVAAGKLGTQDSGESRREVEQHFADNGVGYTVEFPPVPLPLAGGIVSRYGDRNVAQLVYSHGAKAIYVLEVPKEEVRRGTSLYVTPDVLERLDRGEKIIEETPEGRSMVAFGSG